MHIYAIPVLILASWLDVRAESLLREYPKTEDEQVQKMADLFVIEMSGMGNARQERKCKVHSLTCTQGTQYIKCILSHGTLSGFLYEELQ